MKRGRFLKLISLGLIFSLTLSFCLFSFDSKAVSVDMSMPFAQPQLDSYSGYIALHTEEGPLLIYWRLTPPANEDAGFTNMNVTIDNYGITFSSHSNAYMLLMNMYPDGTVQTSYSGLYDGSVNPSLNCQIHAYSIYGNVTNLIDLRFGSSHPGVNVLWGSASWQNSLLSLIAELHSINTSMNGKFDTLIADLYTQLLELKNHTMYLTGIHNWLVDVFMPAFTQYMDTGNWYLYTIDEKLAAIHEQISQFLEMSDADREVVEQYQEQQKQQQDMLKEFTEESQLDKPDIDIDSAIDQNIDFDGIYLYGRILSAVTSHPIVVTMLLIVFTMALIAYILFGKKG